MPINASAPTHSTQRMMTEASNRWAGARTTTTRRLGTRTNRPIAISLIHQVALQAILQVAIRAQLVKIINALVDSCVLAFHLRDYAKGNESNRIVGLGE